MKHLTTTLREQLTPEAVYRLTHDEAFDLFLLIRFAENGGEPFCPRCGGKRPYFIQTRKKWKCRDCLRQFTATSGTVFHSRKMQFHNYLLAIGHFLRQSEDTSAKEIARLLNCRYKTAWRITSKLSDPNITLPDLECHICGDWCDGSLMRMDPRRSRVRNMITAPEVIRSEDGFVLLCYGCQRRVFFAKSYLRLLASILAIQADRSARFRQIRSHGVMHYEH